MDSIASFTIETGGQKGNGMCVFINQQGAWWCNALQLPSKKMLWKPSIYKPIEFVWGGVMHTDLSCTVHSVPRLIGVQLAKY